MEKTSRKKRFLPDKSSIIRAVIVSNGLSSIDLSWSRNFATLEPLTYSRHMIHSLARWRHRGRVEDWRLSSCNQERLTMERFKADGTSMREMFTSKPTRFMGQLNLGSGLGTVSREVKTEDESLGSFSHMVSDASSRGRVAHEGFIHKIPTASCQR